MVSDKMGCLQGIHRWLGIRAVGRIKAVREVDYSAAAQRRAACQNVVAMIGSFRHRGLESLYANGTTRRVASGHVGKLQGIVDMLDRSSGPHYMNLPGFRLHALKGKMKGHYAVSVSGNRRAVFRFEDGFAVDIDYTDYR